MDDTVENKFVDDGSVPHEDQSYLLEEYRKCPRKRRRRAKKPKKLRCEKCHEKHLVPHKLLPPRAQDEGKKRMAFVCDRCTGRDYTQALRERLVAAALESKVRDVEVHSGKTYSASDEPTPYYTLEIEFKSGDDAARFHDCLVRLVSRGQGEAARLKRLSGVKK